MNTKSSLATALKDKEYRDAFVAAQIRMGLPLQCRVLRESREWTQPQLAKVAGMSQPRISEIERPGERRLNLETLLRLASAFDVALQVQFVPFSQLVDDFDNIDLENFYVAPFEKDIAALERQEEKMKSVLKMGARGAAIGDDKKGGNLVASFSLQDKLGIDAPNLFSGADSAQRKDADVYKKTAESMGGGERRWN